MWDPKTKRIHNTWDGIWLCWMFYAASVEIPQVIANNNVHLDVNLATGTNTAAIPPPVAPILSILPALEQAPAANLGTGKDTGNAGSVGNNGSNNSDSVDSDNNKKSKVLWKL